MNTYWISYFSNLSVGGKKMHGSTAIDLFEDDCDPNISAKPLTPKAIEARKKLFKVLGKEPSSDSPEEMKTEKS